MGSVQPPDYREFLRSISLSLVEPFNRWLICRTGVGRFVGCTWSHRSPPTSRHDLLGVNLNENEVTFSYYVCIELRVCGRARGSVMEGYTGELGPVDATRVRSAKHPSEAWWAGCRGNRPPGPTSLTDGSRELGGVGRFPGKTGSK